MGTGGQEAGVGAPTTTEQVLRNNFPKVHGAQEFVMVSPIPVNVHLEEELEESMEKIWEDPEERGPLEEVEKGKQQEEPGEPNQGKGEQDVNKKAVAWKNTDHMRSKKEKVIQVKKFWKRRKITNCHASSCP